MRCDIPINVPNQFHFNAYSKTACVPISIQALFHMYEVMVEHNGMLNDTQWHKIIENGSILWRRWKALPENADRDLPTLMEILAMKECHTFNRKFGTNPIDYGGLVAPDKSGNDSLLILLGDLTRQTRPACALLILPVNICISLVCRHDPSTPHGYRIFLFDSHGKKNDEKKRCELVQFDEYSLIATYLIEKYDIRSLDLLPHRLRASYSEEEVATDFGFHALLFVQQ